MRFVPSGFTWPCLLGVGRLAPARDFIGVGRLSISSNWSCVFVPSGFVGHGRSAKPTTVNLSSTLDEVLKNWKRTTQSLIIHSDRGRQFASAAYRQLLTQHDLSASMARKATATITLLSRASLAVSNTHWFTTTASPPSPPVPPSSITSKPFITIPDSTPALTTKPPTKFESQLNPNYI